ncbi:MAG: chemotaxis protein CheB, partial [Cyclobacteriaceae bacterium]
MKIKAPAKVKKVKRKLPAKKQVKSQSHLFPIVAIGASAGGLEAVSELLKNLDADTGMAFIYVQHLSPDHKSLLTPLLQNVTSMKVQDVRDKILMAPDNVYVIPPDKEIQVTNGHIKLTPRPDVKINLPIDLLFSSLAETHKQNVIGIILSGSASDGTQGMKSIKHEGGLTFAQDGSAKFSSMPKSAITAGVVDFILSPKEIALELVRISKHPYVKANLLKSRSEDLIESSDPDLKIIFNILHKHTQVDFSAYKIKTIKRRIIRRMLLYKMKSLKEYAKLLGKKKEEVDILYQDLLINVTSFFRDTDTYKYLKTTLLPKLLKEKKPGETLRIWVPACSTGEEAFSIAMMLIEIQDSKFSNIPVQIFASDLSAKAVRKARIGLYSKHELESVSPRRIQRFFSKSDGDYRIDKAVRNICVFAPHNILLDPPFSRLDFISCRNLFIYLDTPAQKRALATFHYALHDNGYLMLGKSESISSSANLYREVNKKYKVFSRKAFSGLRTLPALAPRSAQANGLTNDPENKAVDVAETKVKPLVNQGLDSTIDALLVAEFMPASVVINYQMEIVQFRGSTDLFLTHAAGKASFNVLRMARPEIAFALRNTITKVIKTKHRVRKSGIEMILNARVHMVGIDVMPLKIKSDEPLLLILFAEQPVVETFLKERKKGCLL